MRSTGSVLVVRTRSFSLEAGNQDAGVLVPSDSFASGVRSTHTSPVGVIRRVTIIPVTLRRAPVSG